MKLLIEMFSNLSCRERIMLICLVVFAVLVLYYYFFYQPLADNIAVLKEQKFSKEDQISEYLNTISKIPDLEKRYGELKYLEKELKVNQVTTIGEILQIIEDESVKSCIQIRSFVPNEQEKYTQISMLAEGFFEALLPFLDGIGKLMGQIEFNNIMVFKNNQSDYLLNINLELIYHNELLIGAEKKIPIFQINKFEIEANESEKNENEVMVVMADEVDEEGITGKGSNNQEESERDKEVIIKDNKTEKEVILHMVYPYRNVFRNPFKEYRIAQNPSNESDIFTIEAIKEMVPFELKGIIGNNYGRLAVIEYRNQTRLAREKTEIEEFWIIDILDEELVMLYKGVRFKLGMGGGIGESL